MGDLVYAASCSGTLFAFDAASGETVWSHKTGFTFHGEPVVTDELLVIPTDDGSIYAFKLATGEVAWRSELPPQGALPDLVLTGSTVLGLTAAADPFALDVASGELIWGETSPASSRQRVQSPATARGRLYHAGFDGEVTCRDAATGAQIWRRELGAAASAGLLATADALYVGTEDGRLARLDLDSGETLASRELTDHAYGALLFAADQVIALTYPDRIVALTSNLEEERWSLPTAVEWTSFRPLIDGDILIAGSRDGELVAADLADGSTVWSGRLEGKLRGLGSSEDTYYVGTIEGMLYAWRRDEAAACADVEGLSEVIEAARIVLIGEIHGTEESPAFALAVACQAARSGLSVTVGLEIVGSESARVSRFLASDGGAEARQSLLAGAPWQRAYQDGRTSRGILGLIDGLRRLRRAGHSVDVVLFDRPEGRGEERDRLMAATLAGIAQSTSSDRLLVLTGNIHSRLVPGTKWDPEYKPMGYVLAASLGPDVPILALDVERSGGSAWICTGSSSDDCGERSMGDADPTTQPSISIGAEPNVRGHHGTYTLGPLTASPPAVGGR